MTAGVLVCAALPGASAQVVGKMADQVRWWQSAYHALTWSMGRIKANVEGSDNKGQVVEATDVIQAIANSKMGALVQPGSDKAKGWKDTRLKSRFFGHKDLPQIAQDYGAAAAQMVKLANGGDLAAVKDAFGKLGEARKACRAKFRKEE